MPVEQASKPEMIRKLTLAFGAAAVVLAASAVYLAWERLAPAPAAIVTAAVPAAASATEQPPASPASSAKIGDWLVLCGGPQSGGPGCVLQQTLRSRENGRVVLVWTISKDDAGAYRTSFMVPADVDRSKGMVVDIGDGRARGMPFASCGEQTCQARAVFAPDYLQALQRASRITLAVVVPSRPQPLVMGLSSTGLAEALAKL